LYKKRSEIWDKIGDDCKNYPSPPNPKLFYRKNTVSDYLKIVELKPTGEHYADLGNFCYLADMNNEAADAYLMAIKLGTQRDNIYFSREVQEATGKSIDVSRLKTYKQEIEEDQKKFEKEIADMEWESAKTTMGCFITSATFYTLGKPDNCYELNVFRTFRDTWLIHEPDGKDLVAEYYQVAPGIVSKINTLPDKDAIYSSIWTNYLSDFLYLLENNRFSECKITYINMVENLKKKYCR
jgi:hypothetical protein